jgi:hypothetical protein
MESFDEQVDKRRGASSCTDDWPRRGRGLRSGLRPRGFARSFGSLVRCYLLTTVADSITIGFCGTSLIAPRVVVGLASMRFTTSMPLVTLPNTA